LSHARDPFLQRAELLENQGRYDEALGQLQRSLGQDPDNAVTRSRMALALAHMDRDKEAVEHARAAVELDPEDAFVMRVLASVLRGADKRGEALKVAKVAIAMEPDEPNGFAVLAGIHLSRSEWREAREQADIGLALDPEDTTCLNIRSIALRQLGDRREAIVGIQEALALEPEDPTLHANQGWAHLHARQIPEALTSFGEALRLDPDNETAQAGLMEALRARNVVYRWILSFYMWMGRLKPGTQWVVIFGLMFANRILRKSTEGTDFAGAGQVLGAVYLLFIYLTWVGTPFANMLLFLDPIGRRVMKARDKWAGGLFFGTYVAAALIGALAYSAGAGVESFVFVVAGLALGLPISAAFDMRKGARTKVATGIAVVLSLVYLGSGLSLLTSSDPSQAMTLAFASLLGSMLNTWIAILLSRGS
jgi:tetratricopeptide (TPR) repeat protein